MGEFLAMSGVIGSPVEKVREIVNEFAQNTKMKGRRPKGDRGVIGTCGANTIVLYPSSFVMWDDLSKDLSARLQTAVFSFHIHDGDLWMFLLFERGIQIAQFNTLPNYREELDPAERERWRGDAAIVAAKAKVDVASVAPYLVHWDQGADGEGKHARPDDEFPTGNVWQLTDFMRAIGFTFPIDAQGKPMGDAFDMAQK